MRDLGTPLSLFSPDRAADNKAYAGARDE